jgi:hypothetical protein
MTNQIHPTPEQLHAQESIIKKASLDFLEQTDQDFTHYIVPEIERAVYTSPAFIDSSKHGDYVYFMQALKKLIDAFEKARIIGGRMKDESDLHFSV